MSDQELADWIVARAEELGIPLADGVTVRATSDYRRWDSKLRGWVSCDDALCGGILESPVYGHYDKHDNVIELFKPSFTAGFHAFAVSQERIIGATTSRPAIAVQTLGHEGAHSTGIDMIGDLTPTHYNAERMGLEAMRTFRRLYESQR
jgi:hypothetical protein